MSEEKQTDKQARPWQPRWWREDPERWRWAGTIAVVFALIGVFAYQNPEIWQEPAPWQLAEAEQQPAPQLAAEPPLIGDNAPGEPAEPAATAAAPLAPDTWPEPEGPEDEVLAVSAAPASWQAPAGGGWTRGYGYSLDPTLGDYRLHNGCDMELAAGVPVFAAAAGRVIHAADDAAWGGIVIMEHGGGWRTVYKCLKPAVQPGAELAAGEVVGTVLGSPPTEQAQPSHLHFEMILNQVGQDPQQWL